MELFGGLFGFPDLSTWMLVGLSVIALWDLVWKLLAMWKSAKKSSPIWFVALAIFNTIGILPILYIYIFSEWKGKRRKKKK